MVKSKRRSEVTPSWARRIGFREQPASPCDPDHVRCRALLSVLASTCLKGHPADSTIERDSSLTTSMFRTRTNPRCASRGGRRRQRWFLVSSIAVSIVVLVALTAELHASKRGDLSDIVIAATSLVLAWLFFNAMFALHYAHRYYATRQREKPGLDFPGVVPPDYWDFAYFAFVIGMTFQVSTSQSATVTSAALPSCTALSLFLRRGHPIASVSIRLPVGALEPLP